MANITINLANNKDSAIIIRTLPTWKCKVILKLNPISLSINFYMNGQEQPIHTSYLIIAERLTTDDLIVNSNSCWKYIGRYIYDDYIFTSFKSLIEAIEKNISFGSNEIVFRWCAPSNIFRIIPHNKKTHRISFLSSSNYVLCDDSKNQFISELKYLCEILSLMFCKMRICDSINLMA